MSLLYRCKHFIIINKPSLVYSQPNRRCPSLVTVEKILKDKHPSLYWPKEPFRSPFGPPKLVHRLDYVTSGAMVLASSDHAARMLSRGLKFPGGNAGYRIKKFYLGLVNAQLEANALPESGEWESTIENSRAVTKYYVIGPHREYTLILFELITGKKHQIRQHCAQNIAPIVGDRLYSNERGNTKSSQQQPIALHSYNVGIRTQPGRDWITAVAPVEWQWGPLQASNQEKVDSILDTINDVS